MFYTGMQNTNLSFRGISFHKSVPQIYRKTILNNKEISQAAKDFDIKVSLRDAHSEIDNDTWRILKFKINKKGLLNKLNNYYKTIISTKVSDEEIMNQVKKVKYEDLKG